MHYYRTIICNFSLLVKILDILEKNIFLVYSI